MTTPDARPRPCHLKHTPDPRPLPPPPPCPPDTLFGADLTIVEEGTELLHRLEAKVAEKAGKPAPPEDNGHAASSILPMFTSCCPGWVGPRAQQGRLAGARAEWGRGMGAAIRHGCSLGWVWVTARR